MVPKIDSAIGISIYCTKSSGCGGKIRENPADFVVSEIISPEALSKIKEDQGYAVYKLKKQNIDTNHALQKIFRKTGVKLKSLGLKDAKAVTEQFVCSVNRSKSSEDFDSEKFSIKKIGFAKKPLSKKDMIGNHFTIQIRDASQKILQFEDFESVLNFYGYQRFGSKRPVTHLVGKAFIQGEYKRAVDLLVSFTSEYDSQKNSELRAKLRDQANYAKFVDEIPKQMDIEKTVIEEMIRNGDPKRSLRAIPLSMRRFFIQAYQSYIFNRTLSEAFEGGENLTKPQDGDVCFDEMGILGKFEKKSNQLLAIPIVGYSYYKKTRFHYYISKILNEEKISPRDFFLKDMQEVSSEGGFRNALISCRDYSIKDNVVDFTLSRGSFATILLREIMKPKDPLFVGF